MLFKVPAEVVFDFVPARESIVALQLCPQLRTLTDTDVAAARDAIVTTSTYTPATAFLPLNRQPRTPSRLDLSLVLDLLASILAAEEQDPPASTWQTLFTMR